MYRCQHLGILFSGITPATAPRRVGYDGFAILLIVEFPMIDDRRAGRILLAFAIITFDRRGDELDELTVIQLIDGAIWIG